VVVTEARLDWLQICACLHISHYVHTVLANQLTHFENEREHLIQSGHYAVDLFGHEAPICNPVQVVAMQLD